MVSPGFNEVDFVHPQYQAAGDWKGSSNGAGESSLFKGATEKWVTSNGATEQRSNGAGELAREKWVTKSQEWHLIRETGSTRPCTAMLRGAGKSRLDEGWGVFRG